MKPHYAFTADHLQNLPPNLRALIGKHFADSRWVQTCIFYRRLSERYRRTLFFHAGLTTQEFDQPLRRIDESDCRWAKALNLALGELHSLFAEAPDILSSIKPEHYFRSEHYFRPE
ncbi:hypothetical protein [Dickeya dianthicola]|uniref:hypothetical protein n=1 Tax=Dickeya dianthicola TaxID=204039 RepID=UPI0030161A38